MAYTDADLARIRANPDIIIIDDGGRTRVTHSAHASRITPDDHSTQTSVLEERFAATWQDVGGPALEREVRFHPTRRWRFDFACVPCKFAVEVQGGLYRAESGHRSHAGVTRDFEKLNAAQLLGWSVFQVTAKSMSDTKFIASLVEFCKAKLVE